MRKGFLVFFVSVLLFGATEGWSHPCDPTRLTDVPKSTLKEIIEVGNRVGIEDDLERHLARNLIFDGDDGTPVSHVHIEFVREIMRKALDMGHLMPAVEDAGGEKIRRFVSISDYLEYVDLAKGRQRVREAIGGMSRISNKERRVRVAREKFRQYWLQLVYRIWYERENGGNMQLRNQLIDKSEAAEAEFGAVLHDVLAIKVKMEGLHQKLEEYRFPSGEIPDFIKQRNELHAQLREKVELLKKRAFEMVSSSPYEVNAHLEREMETYRALRGVYWDVLKRDSFFMSRWAHATHVFVVAQHRSWLNWTFFKRYILVPVATLLAAKFLGEFLEKYGFMLDAFR